LDSRNSACVIVNLLWILLTSETFPSLIGTLKSALMTTLEAGLRCLDRSERVAFFIFFYFRYFIIQSEPKSINYHLYYNASVCRHQKMISINIYDHNDIGDEVRISIWLLYKQLWRSTFFRPKHECWYRFFDV